MFRTWFRVTDAAFYETNNIGKKLAGSLTDMSDNSILILDPYKSLLSTYRRILEADNYVVETALNLDEAYQKFSLKQYSVFITEYISPFEDICRMIQWLKHQSPETYIIMVTHADIDKTTYEALFEIGLDDLIFKPYPPEKILVHIRKGIRQRNLIVKKQEAEKHALLDPIAIQIQKPIFNPTYFRKCLRQELKRAKRHQHPLSLLLITVPTEAMMGERFGLFCEELARLVRTYTREEDMVGRENGNFGILLPETDHAGSQALLKRLTGLIQNEQSLQSDGAMRPYTETLSFQTFTYPEEFLVPESLMSVLEEINKEYSHN
jgi:PleD family two-component response regulator